MGLSEEQQKIVDDEVGMAGRVARRVATSLAQQSEAKKPQNRGKLDADLMQLREDIGNARGEDVAALLAEMMRTANVAAVDLPKAQGSIDPQAPYFGHLRLEEKGRKRDVLIGKRGMIDRDAGVVIVDWRNAPVSRIYYRYDEGDDYEEELGEQVREGAVLVRRTLTFSRGRLLRIRCPSGTFSKSKSAAEGTEEWVALLAGEGPELKGGVGKAARAPSSSSSSPSSPKALGLGDEHNREDRHLPEITALIDGKQFDAMTSSTSGLVVLQGGAGSGKTTIALHRVAWLVFQDAAPAAGTAQRFRPSHILVVVAQRQLVRYIERLLPSLDVRGVRVMAYVDWTIWAVERLLPKHGRRIVDDVTPDVSRVKKHPALLAAVRTQVEGRAAKVATMLAEAVDGRADGPAVLLAWNASHAQPLVPRLQGFLSGALEDLAVASDTRERAKRAAKKALDLLTDLVSEWEELITDEALLRTTGVDESALQTALAHTRRQVEELPDDVDIDDEHKTPVDEPGFDASDPIQAFDVHDLPLLMAMQVARHGALVERGGNAIINDHVVVDEAQDLSAMELLPLIASTGDRQSMTLAGDVVQKVVFDNGYETWEELFEQLGPSLKHGALAVEPLRLSYRSTAEVVEFAREVLGPLAPKEAPRAVRSGAPVEVFSFVDAGEEVAFLADNLRALMAREPLASCAVLLRYPERARFFYDHLVDAEVPRLRLVLPGDGGPGAASDDEFSFAPGIDVTTIAKVKGLEYDYVILVEVTEPMFPEALVSRHLLHIGATRAAHQLWVTTSIETPSSLLPTARIREG
ncbi:MAG: 3'-5' exonuclease [Deltaproteobacteria bacterium]|nr:3'-5' exonuclease [Deltaproteobacteria bacterium]